MRSANCLDIQLQIILQENLSSIREQLQVNIEKNKEKQETKIRNYGLFPVFYRKITCFLCFLVNKSCDTIRVSKEKAAKEKELNNGQFCNYDCQRIWEWWKIYRKRTLKETWYTML